ncbi:MAG: class I SAM-dependent methyltransferase [Clostridia bacterium]|nr:class I SAM-dependent methyltransferase [Clostridia bacterium]
MSDYNGYDVIASVYNRFNGATDYKKWTEYLVNCFGRFTDSSSGTPRISSVLELGCGTGNITAELAKLGYDMTGLDSSFEMLAVADKRMRDEGLSDVLLIRSDMAEFELYGTVDAVICCLDGINHLYRRDDLLACLWLVSNYLNDGGLFIFDLNTPYKFKTVYAGRDYIFDDEGSTCLWQNCLSKKGDVCDFIMTVFEKDAGDPQGRWTREDGVIRERAYGLKTVRKALEDNGLEIVNISEDLDFSPVTETADRWFIAARKNKVKNRGLGK